MRRVDAVLVKRGNEANGTMGSHRPVLGPCKVQGASGSVADDKFEVASERGVGPVHSPVQIVTPDADRDGRSSFPVPARGRGARRPRRTACQCHGVTSAPQPLEPQRNIRYSTACATCTHALASDTPRHTLGIRPCLLRGTLAMACVLSGRCRSRLSYPHNPPSSIHPSSTHIHASVARN